MSNVRITTNRAAYADTSSLSGVSAGGDGSDLTATMGEEKLDASKVADRMLYITIKIARVLEKHPPVRQKLRLLEQRWG